LDKAAIDPVGLTEAVARSSLLASLTQAQKETLLGACRLKRAQKGEVIWLVGSHVDFFGLVIEGFVKMVRGTSKGAEVILEIFGPGQIFGLFGSIEGLGCPLTAIAITNATYAQVPKETFRPIYEGSHTIKDELLRRALTRLHSTTHLMTALTKGRIEQRVAVLLKVLASSYGVEANGHMTIEIPLTRQDLADMAGTTVETTIRVMSRWQKSGVIRTDHHLITLLKPSRIDEVIDT